MAEVYTDTNELGKFYFKDPEMTIQHREDGPAVEYANGSKLWFVNGVRHRLDGPATQWSDSKAWYVNGVFIFEIGRISNQLVTRIR